MPFEPIRRILPQAIQSAGIARQVDAARVVEEAMQVLQQLWGEEKAQFVEVVSFHDGIIKLRSQAPAALQELKGSETKFQNELNRRLGSKVVHRLLVTGY